MSKESYYLGKRDLFPKHTDNIGSARRTLSLCVYSIAAFDPIQREREREKERASERERAREWGGGGVGRRV